MISFERIDMNNVPWPSIESIGEINVFQTQAWIKFLVETQEAEPVIAAVKSNGNIIGYFTGLVVRKFGLKILGSPFRGWATYFMGFNLLPEASYHEVLQAFPSFAFNDLGCHYLEVVDPNLKSEDCNGLSYKIESLPWFAIDLTPSEEELFANIKSAGRRNIRKSSKSGVVIEDARETTGFAEEYHSQYIDVLEKRSLVPTYSAETVQNVIDCLKTTGNLLLLRAKNSENFCIATGIFLGLNKRGVYWGGASWREHQSVRPNEPLFWYAMKALKAQGITELHMGGECDQFKEKLGSYKVKIYRIRKARNVVLDTLINLLLSQRGSRFKNWALRRL
jgi:hypothetical protein